MTLGAWIAAETTSAVDRTTWGTNAAIMSAIATALGLIITIFFQIRGWRLNRLVVGLQAIVALDKRLDEDGFLRRKRLAAAYLEGTDHTDAARTAVIDMLDFFEGVGFQLRRRLLDVEVTWQFFSHCVIPFFHLARQRGVITEARKRDPNFFTEVEYMHGKLLAIEARKHPKGVPEHCLTAEYVEQFLAEWRRPESPPVSVATKSTR